MKIKIWKCLFLVLIVLSHLMMITHTFSLSLNLESVNISENHDTKYIRDIIRRSKAAEIHSLMNENIDPCQNFYQFTCGNWARLNPAIDIGQTSVEHRMLSVFDARLTAMLKAGAATNHTTKVEKDVINFYNSCLRLRDANSTQRAKLIELTEEFGGMPALKEIDGALWDEKHFDWIEIAAKILHKYDIPTILQLNVAMDSRNNTLNCLAIGQKEFGLETRSAYLDESAETFRQSYRIEIARELHLGLGLEVHKAYSIAKELFNFEMALADGLFPDGILHNGNETFLPTTVEGLHNKYAPDLDIKRFVNITMGKVITDVIYEYNERYMKNLISVINRTPKRIIANYIMYILIHEFVVIPKVKQDEHERLCLNQVKGNFKEIIDTMVYRTFRNDNIEESIKLMFRNLSNVLRSQFQSDKFNWMQQKTREYAIDKLNAAKFYIYLNEDDDDDDDDIKEGVDFVTVRKELYISSAKSRSKRLDMLNVNDTVTKGRTVYSPEYRADQNQIIFPVLYLQPYHFLALDYPHAVQYSNIGYALAHEIIHAFDDEGRQYDKNGNLYNWWDELSVQAFDERKQCFVEQYSKYLYNGRYLAKSTAQAENIADNGGVRLAYAAYLNALAENSNTYDLNSEILPNLNYTNKQLFFITFAQFWCEDSTNYWKKVNIVTDEHCPNEIRVLGTLSNFQEFANVFNCPLGSPMNPEHKCELY